MVLKKRRKKKKKYVKKNSRCLKSLEVVKLATLHLSLCQCLQVPNASKMLLLVTIKLESNKEERQYCHL